MDENFCYEKKIFFLTRIMNREYAEFVLAKNIKLSLIWNNGIKEMRQKKKSNNRLVILFMNISFLPLFLPLISINSNLHSKQWVLLYSAKKGRHRQ